jgi:tRNA(adenine34) deaminase
MPGQSKPKQSTRGKKSATSKKKRWVAKVKTDSTHPPEGLFTKDSTTIARTLASKKVSPKGPASGMRMLTYFINRGGRGLTRKRRAELEKAKTLLSTRIHRDRSVSKRAA